MVVCSPKRSIVVPAVIAQKRFTAKLYGSNGTVTGQVSFDKNSDWDDRVYIKGTVEGLTPGMHGFHIHEFGDITGGCGSAGGHFNPHNVSHGGPDAVIRHVGDLGNIEANQAGLAEIDLVDSVVSIGGPNCMLGRAVVVHAGVDDLGTGGVPDSLTTGNAGGRVACGVIGRAKV